MTNKKINKSKKITLLRRTKKSKNFREQIN